MIYEFALLPEVIEEALTKPDEGGQRELINLLFRILENGYLVDLGSGRWRDYVFSLLSQSQAAYQGDILELLKFLYDHNRIVPHEIRSEMYDTSWLDEANSARSQCSYEWLVISHDSYQGLSAPPDHYLPFPLPPSPKAAWQNWMGNRDRSLRKCEPDFRTALAPLFRHASRVHLVDPFFSCRTRKNKDFLDLCIDLLGASSAQHLQLFIHAGDPQNDRNFRECPDNRAKAWTSYLHSVPIKRPMTFNVFLWSSGFPERVHNRYIFTDQHFGISVGDGLECHAPHEASTDTWQLKSVREADNVFASFTIQPVHRQLAHVAVSR